MMEDVVIIRYSEIAVKGHRTRKRMEDLLIKNIEEALRSKGLKGEVVKGFGRIIIREPKPSSKEVALVASKVFGVKSTSPAKTVNFSDLEELADKSFRFFHERVRGKVFAVRARRVGSHNFTSKDIERVLGKKLLEGGALRVNLEKPEYTAYVEVRENRAYFYDEIFKGPGGLPLGSEDPVLVLFSGGFDSTVSAWLMMKRGSPISLLNFYFGIAEPLKIIIEIADYLKREWSFGSEIYLYLTDFTQAINIIKENVRKDYRVLVLRRLMAEKSQEIAKDNGFYALATGECVGQVSSQTVNNLKLIWEGIDMPVLRPVICMDKDEITEIARNIGVYDLTSKQVETCGKLGSPDPKASSKIFNEELHKVKDSLDINSAKTYKFVIGKTTVDEILSTVLKKR